MFIFFQWLFGFFGQDKIIILVCFSSFLNIFPKYDIKVFFRLIWGKLGASNFFWEILELVINKCRGWLLGGVNITGIHSTIVEYLYKLFDTLRFLNFVNVLDFKWALLGLKWIREGTPNFIIIDRFDLIEVGIQFFIALILFYFSKCSISLFLWVFIVNSFVTVKRHSFCVLKS